MKTTFRTMMTGTLAALCLGASVALSSEDVSARVIGDNYPSEWQVGWGVDPWNMYWRQCTSFVAYRLHTENGFTLPRGYGNAVQWGSYAQQQGHVVNQEPAVGAVAWYGSGAFGASAYGHVAWVAEVNGDQVTLEEYNYNTGQGPEKYHRRTIHKSQATGYIHFKDLQESDTSQKLPASGTYTFTKETPVKNQASFTAETVARYQSGQKANYDRTFTADGYRWISYISYSGVRRYVPVAKLS